MTKFLKSAAVALSAIFAAYFFLIDGFIKSQLEHRGALILQAPVDIGKVVFHLIPTSLTLRDVQIGNTRLPTQNLVQTDELSLPLSLRDLLAHQVLIDTIDIHGLRFNRPRVSQNSTAAPAIHSATASAQLREVLQRVQQTVNHPLASNTIDPNAPITGALLAEQFKPWLTQVTAALSALAAPAGDVGDWRIFARRVAVDGQLDVGDNSLRFSGSIDNVTPNPQRFDAVTHVDLRSIEGEPATLHIYGSLDRRRLAQAALRFDLHDFPLAQWSLSDDPELKIMIIAAKTDAQAMLSLTGNQFDLDALTHFHAVRFDIASGSSDVARVIADVWRRTDVFDINLQASGNIAAPILKMNSSLDVPLANALRQLQPTSTFPQADFPQTTP